MAKDIVVELDIQNYPRTCESFLSLCVQNARKNKDSSSNDPPLRTNRTSPQPTYRGCEFHRVVPGLCVQAGDWERFDGTGGFSPLYGRNWKDEEGGDKKYNKHDREGIVSMANAGKPNTNGSQFFVTLKPTPHLDRKHTAFGRIVSGMESVRKMSDVERGEKDRPVSLQRIVIEDCGRVSLGQRLKEKSIRRSRSKEDKRKKSRKRERKKREKKRRRHHRDDSSTGDSSYSSNDSDDDSGSRNRKGHRRERHSRKHRKRKRRRRTNDKYHASSDDDDESSNSSASSISRDQKHQKRRSSRDESSRRDSRKKRSREKKGRNVEKRTTR